MRRRTFLASTATGLALPLTGRIAWGQQKRVAEPEPATGPLHRHPKNPRYFADGAGRAVLLTGSHMWNNLVDMGGENPPAKLDFTAYLDFLNRHQHNFIRLWAWESTTWDTRKTSWGGPAVVNHVAPHPYARTGPGSAQDGKPKFDLSQFNQAYFDRLRDRVKAAGQRGIYVSIMLFEGWNLQFGPGAWNTHPMHPKNNINQIGSQALEDGRGLKVHELAVPAITKRQEAYVRKVIDTVNDLDNVLYEISNENHGASTAWQYHLIDFIHEYERHKPKQHPVGMTFQYKGGTNKVLRDSPADWISPNPAGGYRDDPPAGDGKQVVLTDTDHLWGIGGNRAWVWKSFLRGLNPLFMDPYDGSVLGNRFDAKWAPIRTGMQRVAQLAAPLDLAQLQPHGELASTSYCLANPGAEYLVYATKEGEFSIQWPHKRLPKRCTLVDPVQGTTRIVTPDAKQGRLVFRSPWKHGALVHCVV